MNRTLYLLAEDFSNDSKECFFEKELPYHCTAFEKVYVLSLYPNTNKVLKFEAPNLEVLHFNYFEPCNRIRILSKYLFRILGVLFFELAHTHRRYFYFRSFGKLLNQLVLQCSAAERFEKFIAKDIQPDTLFYTYWFKQWTVALSIIKQKHPQLKFVSRVHGGDYDEDQLKTTLPFRYFQLKQIQHIFPVSDYGRNYLMHTFKVAASKMTTSRLGLDVVPLEFRMRHDRLIIVSCSAVIPLKRVHLIIEILKHIQTPVKWVHFGGGELFEEVKRKASDLPHTVEFKGHVPNHEFINYLKSSPVSLFINVSESEGIPVSMMEAISQGVPLIGTKVCGVPEIVTAKTGLLLPVNFDPVEVAERITEMHQAQTIYSKTYRSGIREFYKENFFAEKNYKDLEALLKSI